MNLDYPNFQLHTAYTFNSKCPGPAALSGVTLRSIYCPIVWCFYSGVEFGKLFIISFVDNICITRARLGINQIIEGMCCQNDQSHTTRPACLCVVK
jgi:hypothetical protein